MRWEVRALRCGVLVCALGCGRVGFDTTADGALVADAAPDAPFATGPFSTPVPIPELSSPVEEDDVSLTDDQLEIYFMSLRTGTALLYRSTRPTASGPWGTPLPVTELQPAGEYVNNPRVTGDGLALYFATDRAPNGGLDDVFVATRPDRASPWSAPEPVPGLATADDEYEPWSMKGGLVMYYLGNPGGLSRVERADTSAAYGSRISLTELQSPNYDGGAWVDASERVIVFHSDRDGPRDIYEATRASAADPFDPPVALSSVNSTSNSDSDAWLSPDGRVIVFVSTRGGNDDIYIATR